MVARGTIGWLKVMLTKGAIPTSPSGCTRSTSRGPWSMAGASMSGPAGKGRSMVSPVRGGGSVSAGRLKSVVSLSSSSHGGSRSVTARTSSAPSGLPSTSFTAAAPGPRIASPSLRRTVNTVPCPEPPNPRADALEATVGASVGALLDRSPSPSPPEPGVEALPDPTPSPPLPVAGVEAFPDPSPAPPSGSPSSEQAPASNTATIPTIRQRFKCSAMDQVALLAQSQGYDDASHRSVPRIHGPIRPANSRSRNCCPLRRPRTSHQRLHRSARCPAAGTGSSPLTLPFLILLHY